MADKRQAATIEQRDLNLNLKLSELKHACANPSKVMICHLIICLLQDYGPHELLMTHNALGR